MALSAVADGPVGTRIEFPINISISALAINANGEIGVLKSVTAPLQ